MPHGPDRSATRNTPREPAVTVNIHVDSDVLSTVTPLTRGYAVRFGGTGEYGITAVTLLGSENELRRLLHRALAQLAEAGADRLTDSQRLLGLVGVHEARARLGGEG
jgi:hypothetical protein